MAETSLLSFLSWCYQISGSFRNLVYLENEAQIILIGPTMKQKGPAIDFETFMSGQKAPNTPNKDISKKNSSPKRSPASSRPSSANVPSHVESLYQKNQLYKERRELLLKKKEEKEIEECTFAPQLNETSSRFINTSKDIHERSTEWSSHKEKKLQELREKDKDKDLEGCTFSPELHRTEINFSKDSPPITMIIPGCDEWIKRQERARLLHEEKIRLQEVPVGAGWKNEVTIPEEFNLSHHKSLTKIKSLDRPVEGLRLFSTTEIIEYSPT